MFSCSTRASICDGTCEGCHRRRLGSTSAANDVAELLHDGDVSAGDLLLSRGGPDLDVANRGAVRGVHGDDIGRDLVELPLDGDWPHGASREEDYECCDDNDEDDG